MPYLLQAAICRNGLLQARLLQHLVLAFCRLLGFCSLLCHRWLLLEQGLCRHHTLAGCSHCRARGDHTDDLGICCLRSLHKDDWALRVEPSQAALLPHAACLRVLLRLDRPRGTSWSFRTAAFGGLSSRTGAPSGLSFRTASTKKTVHEITNDRVCSVTGFLVSVLATQPFSGFRNAIYHGIHIAIGQARESAFPGCPGLWFGKAHRAPQLQEGTMLYASFLRIRRPICLHRLLLEDPFQDGPSLLSAIASCPSSICAISSCPGLSAIASCHGLGPIELCLYSCLYRLYYML